MRGSGLIMQASMGRFFFVEGSTDEDGHLHDISVDDLKATDSFDTVEQFWHYYDHIVRANELPPNIDCCLFVDGIKPDIDHEANRGGGKWCGRVSTFSRVCPCRDPVDIGSVCVHVYVCAQPHICALVRVCACMHACMHVYRHASTHTPGHCGCGRVLRKAPTRLCFRLFLELHVMRACQSRGAQQ